MKFRLLAAFALGVFGLTIQARAASLVYLVGLRHVYSVQFLPDPHENDRQQVEEDYAAAVQKAQKQYDTDMASIHGEESQDNGAIHQVDRDQVQQNLEEDIANAADRREGAFSEMYTNCDYVRASHPEFRVDQDGPYQVIEVQTAPGGEYSNVVYYQPYPWYVGVCPFGWAWGRPYAWGAFGIQIGLFHSTWISIGAPVFAPMYYGGGVFIVNAPIREAVIVNRGGWVGGHPPMITSGERSVLASSHAAQARSGYFDKGPGGRSLSEFQKPGAKYNRSGSASRYSRQGGTTRSQSGGGPSHDSNGSSRDDGYSHSARTGSSTGTGSHYGSSTSGSHTGRYNPSGASRYARPSSTSHSGSRTSGHADSGQDSSHGNRDHGGNRDR